MSRFCLAVGLATCCLIPPSWSQSLLLEAESFEHYGGWKLDTQFIETMGSPYLLAHGLGQPVEDATTTAKFPEQGSYHVFVRTKDWVAPWQVGGQPGRFRLSVDGTTLEAELGTNGEAWGWQYGGQIEVRKKNVEVGLQDLTGFDGRCDAVFFTKTNSRPPHQAEVLKSWRKEILGLPDQPAVQDGYDLVVIGGGYSGLGTAISAARMGCRVALIQNRPVLGGNGSSEVRVWSQGLIRRGKYPRVGEIVEEFCDQATKSPGSYEEFGDADKEALVRSEKNIRLFLNHHAYNVDCEDGRISGVYVFDTQTSEQKKFTGKLYVDCTGHGTIGFLANADWEMTPKGRMGMSNMWAWDEGESPVEFPQTPWALDLEMEDFPYPRDHHGQWFWEGGFDKDPIEEAELIRDWNLRAVFGAFNAMKNRGGAAKHKRAYLTWVAFIGGPRESRRLLGDVLLTQDDIISKRVFRDGCVPSTWSIDLHYPRKQYLKKYPDNPFISIAEHDRRIDRDFGYPVPYRCFYSRNIDNLFMAGRCISVTHEALGTVRVMKTCGMMGEVVGRAASICIARDCLPRDVYERYWDEMDELLQLPGKAFRGTVHDPIQIPEDSMELASSIGVVSGLNPIKLGGLVVDDRKAVKRGRWQSGSGLKGYVGWGYLYSGDSNASIEFTLKVPADGRYDVRLAYQPHKNRGNRIPVAISAGPLQTTVRIDMKRKPPLENGFISLGQFDFKSGQSVSVVVSVKDGGGLAHADAVQLMRKDP
jgi:hypothetical protein